MVFNLVVTCVGSKNKEGPYIEKAAGNLIKKGVKNSISALYNEWTILLEDYMSKEEYLTQAEKLYKGPMWNASLDAFDSIEGTRNLWIISCGFGFISARDEVCGYHATFKSGKKFEKESIYSSGYFTMIKKINVMRSWWDYLTKNNIIETTQPHSIHELVNHSSKDDAVMIVAGKDYYNAIFDDLNQIQISRNLPKLALIGIKRTQWGFEPEIPTHLSPYIQSYSDGTKLQAFLGCGGIQRHPKSAKYLIEQYNRTGNLTFQFP